jgi:hypothetical protein
VIIQIPLINEQSSLIPWETKDVNFAISGAILFKICSLIGVPALFLDAIFEQEYWIRPGNALLLKRDENDKILRMGMKLPST